MSIGGLDGLAPSSGGPSAVGRGCAPQLVLHALRHPERTWPLKGVGLVPGGEEEGKMRMNRRFDSVASLREGVALNSAGAVPGKY
jgi:hypothetical protein